MAAATLTALVGASVEKALSLPIFDTVDRLQAVDEKPTMSKKFRLGPTSKLKPPTNIIGAVML